MDRLFSALLFLVAYTQCLATVDDIPHLSPDGRFAIYNIGDTAKGAHYFEIRARDGRVIYSSRGEFEFGTFAEEIRWTRDSRFALFRVQRGKLDSTCIFSAADSKLERLVADDADSWTIPIRWLSPQKFVVEVSGPHGGKSFGGGWHYRKTYRATTRPFRLECVYRSNTIHEKEDLDGT